MTRRNRSPEENERRAKIRELLQAANIGNMKDIQELFKETIAEFMENGLEAELDDELGYSKYDYKSKNTDNSRNGHSEKTLRTSFGNVELSVPRDRKSEFEPQLLKKNQTSISQDIEEKIISMYAKGMSTDDISDHVRDIYGISVSDTTVSRITDKILPLAREWQQRPLESVYAVVYLDAIHYHVRSEGQIVKKAVYIAIAIDLDGHKDVLGMWVGENESAKYWASVLNSLKNRGVEDIFIACTDNLKGFDSAINAVFPNTEIQNCIIHQLRNSGKYVSYKDIKELMNDLKAVYTAPDEQSALGALEYLHDERDRRIQQTAEESDQSEVSIPDRRQPLQNVIPCYDRYNEKMDRPSRRLGKDTRSTVHILRWKDAGIGQNDSAKKRRQSPNHISLTYGSGTVMVLTGWGETVKMIYTERPKRMTILRFGDGYTESGIDSERYQDIKTDASDLSIQGIVKARV